MPTAPHVESLLEPAGQKAVIALLDPEITLAPFSSGIPLLRIVEEDVVIVIEFPAFEYLERFIEKMRAL